MKPIKLLFSISLLFFTNNLKSQSFFEDSASYYTYSSAYNLGGGIFVPSMYKEQIFLDSVTSNGEYYHVKPSNYIYIHQLELSKNFNLRVLDSQVFFTGFLYRYYNDSFWNENLLIYDYTLKVGDTLTINFNSPSDTVSVLIDSISTMQTLDGQYRMVQYFSPLNSASSQHVRNFINASNYNIMGLCGINGFLPYLKFYQFKSLFSVCKSDELIYQNDSFISSFERDLKRFGYQYGQTIINNSCNLDSLENMIWLINKLDITTTVKTSFKIYPNPANQFLNITSSNHSLVLVEIRNHLGQMVYSDSYTPQIDISLFKNGIYFLFLKDELGMIYKHKLSVLK
jgi:hypothetical protein